MMNREMVGEKKMIVIKVGKSSKSKDVIGTWNKTEEERERYWTEEGRKEKVGGEKEIVNENEKKTLI